MRWYIERKSSLALLIHELSPWTREIWTESFLIFQLRNGKLEARGEGGGVHMRSCLTLYRRIPHLLIKHIFTLTFFSKIVQFEVGDAEIKHDWIEIYTSRLFAELAPILCLFAVFGNVTMKLLPSQGRVYFSTFETGMEYKFLFVLANKHGGSDSVLNHALSFWLLTLRHWLNCVNIPGGPSIGGDIHTEPTYHTQGLSRSAPIPEPLIYYKAQPMSADTPQLTHTWLQNHEEISRIRTPPHSTNPLENKGIY